MDLGSHMLDLVDWMMGPLQLQHCHVSQQQPPPGDRRQG